MNVENIKSRYEELNAELKETLSHMERTDRLFIIRDEIKSLQNICSHSNGNFDFSTTAECPYCGKRF